MMLARSRNGTGGHGNSGNGGVRAAWRTRIIQQGVQIRFIPIARHGCPVLLFVVATHLCQRAHLFAPIHPHRRRTAKTVGNSKLQ